MDSRFSYLDKESHDATIFLFGWRMHRYVTNQAERKGIKNVDDKYVDMMDKCVDDINRFLEVYKNKNYVDGDLYEKMRKCVAKNMLK